MPAGPPILASNVDEARVRCWRIAAIRPDDPAVATLMFQFDPKRTLGRSCGPGARSQDCGLWRCEMASREQGMLAPGVAAGTLVG